MQCLPDIVESYIGAIFVDSKFNFAEVERFFETHIRHYFEDMSIYDTFANCHPTTYLHNLLTLSFGCNNYRLLSSELPTDASVINAAAPQIIAVVMIHDKIIEEGVAGSSKYAKLKASSHALELLTGLAPFEYRQMYGCDCAQKKRDEEAGEEAEEGVVAERVGSAI
jgi:endoribonuclease Dicer